MKIRCNFLSSMTATTSILVIIRGSVGYNTVSRLSFDHPLSARVRNYARSFSRSNTSRRHSLIRKSVEAESRNYALRPSFAASSTRLKMKDDEDSSSTPVRSTSRSRTPFSAPRSAVDDSTPNTMLDKLESPDLSWSRLGLSHELATLLSSPNTENGLGFIHGPTPVQNMVIPAILSGCAAAVAKIPTSRRVEPTPHTSPAPQPRSSFSDTLSSDHETESHLKSTKEKTLSIHSDSKGVQSIAFAAATGSGKTLAYLLPIVQSLKAQEVLAQTLPIDQQGYLRRPKRPRAIVLAPTRELATQIASVLKTLSHHVKISSAVVVGGEDYGTQRKKLEGIVDVVVASPGRLVKHWNDGNVFLGSVQFVVIDEFDTMLEQGFQSDIGNLIHPLLYKHKGAFSSKEDLSKVELAQDAPQVILTSATMTNAVRRLLNDPSLTQHPTIKKQYPTSNDPDTKILLPKNMRLLTAPGLHRVVPRLRQVFVDVGNADKLSLLVDVVSGSGGGGSVLTTKQKMNQASHGLTLVFCNTVISCRAAQHALAESGIPSLCYHGEMNSAARQSNLDLFRAAGKMDENDPIVVPGRKKSPQSLDDNHQNDEDSDSTTSPLNPVRVLVCTDIAARGLDVPEVDHVVMFDFPLNAIDYLHRAGRTARGVNQAKDHHVATSDSVRSGSGRVTALVAKRDKVLALAIEGAVQRGEPLDGLSSRKSDYAPGSKLSDRRLGSGIIVKGKRGKIGNTRIERSRQTESSSMKKRVSNKKSR